MRQNLRNSVFILLSLLMPVALGACSHSANEHAEDGTTYTCPMHPQIVQSKPGTCPVCSMDLVPVSGHGEAVEIKEDLAYLLQPTGSTFVSSVATTKPQEKTVQASVEMEGIITYDPRKIYTVPARVNGRIEKLFVKYNFQPIRKGQKLMEIYSPELITAQKELLYLVQSAPEDTELIGAAKQKLRLMGATDEQIGRLIRTGEESYTFALYSPYDGYVIGLNTAAPTATPGVARVSAAGTGGGMGAMGSGGSAIARSSPTATTAAEAMQLREGMYVNAGQSLLRIVNPNHLWAEFNVPAGEVSALAKGTPVEIAFPQVPGEQLQAKVDFFQPFFDEGANFAKVRVYLPEQHRLAMVGQLVSARASYTTAPALWVPKTALVDIGKGAVAFKKVNDVFEPVPVTVGATEGNETQVLAGLQQEDVLAANAQFLIDSESFINIQNNP